LSILFVPHVIDLKNCGLSKLLKLLTWLKLIRLRVEGDLIKLVLYNRL